LRVRHVKLDDSVTLGVTGRLSVTGGAIAIVVSVAAIAPVAGAAHFVYTAAFASDTRNTALANMPAVAAIVLINIKIYANVGAIGQALSATSPD
jgi:hypothetical protein